MVDMNSTYTIQKGNTLWGIAKKYGTTVDELLKLNPKLKDPDKIQIGAVINLPKRNQGMGTSIEHTTTNQASGTAQSRSAAHKKAVAEIIKAKKASATTVSQALQAAQDAKSKPAPTTPTQPNQETVSLIKKEIQKRHLKNIDIQYWSKIVDKVANQSDFPKEILVSIIGRETKFAKNIASKNGHGAMQQTTIAIEDFFPSSKGNWNGIYDKLDSKLLNDILYKKDANGNILKDKTGKPILKYRNAEELYIACGKDDELSVKTGVLLFRMQYAKAVARGNYGSASYATVPKAIDQIKAGNISLSQNEYYVRNAIQNYNGSSLKRNYGEDVVDSLKQHKFNFYTPIIRT